MAQNTRTCPICGQPTSQYMGKFRKDGLCPHHATLLRKGEIVQCDVCGNWHNSNENCTCNNGEKYKDLPTEGFDTCIVCGAETDGYAFCIDCWKKLSRDEMLKRLNAYAKNLAEKHADDNINTNTTKETVENSNAVIHLDENGHSRCITCGKETDGFLFCPSCYRKYKNKELLFKISNCTSVELLDDSYEGRYVCKDGHVVKSKSEREIDNFLFEHGIPHAYEKDLPYGKTNKEILHPDFFLPNYLGVGKHVYIEHWGYNENNLHYTKTKKFKLPIYKQLGITLICTYEKTDASNIEASLERKLNKNFLVENQINFEED